MSLTIETMRVCVYQWLTDIRLHWMEIAYLEDQMNALRYRLEGLKSLCDDRVSGSKVSDTLVEGMAQLEDLIMQWNDRMLIYSTEYASALEMCQTTIETKAVWMHIVDHEPWSEVGRRLGYSESYIWRIKNDGIRTLYDLMPRNYAVQKAI